MDKDQIVREYVKVQNSIKAYALTICGDFHLAEDICQEVAVKLIQRADAYDPSRPFLPWALFITRCETSDYLKKYNKKNCLVLDAEISELLEQTYLEVDGAQNLVEKAHAIQSCMKKLNDDNLALFKAKYIDRIPVKQLAINMKKSFLSIQSLLNRLREKLKKCIVNQLESTHEA